MRGSRVGEAVSKEIKRRLLMMGVRAWMESDGAAGNCSCTNTLLLLPENDNRLDFLNEERLIRREPPWTEK